MKHVMVLGDYFNFLEELSHQLEKHYNLSKIAFLNEEINHRYEFGKNWKLIDFRDFHELTIKIMEFEPDVIVYQSPYNRLHQANLNQEFADMLNIELLEHLRESTSIHSTHLIILQPKLNVERFPRQNVLERYKKEGETVLSEINKKTFLIHPEVANHSKEGLLSWIINVRSEKEFANKLEVIPSETLSKFIIEVIDNNLYGSRIINGIAISELELGKYENLSAKPFSGSPQNFDYLLV